MSEEKRKQFNEAITDVQNVFFDIFSKYEGYEVENSRNREDILDLKEQLKTSENKRQELAAKYSNLRVSFFCVIIVNSNQKNSYVYHISSK